MSAFPNSGRSDDGIRSILRGRLRPQADAGQQGAGRLEQIGPDQRIAAFGDTSVPVNLTGRESSRCEPQVGADIARSSKARGVVNSGHKGERGDADLEFRDFVECVVFRNPGVNLAVDESADSYRLRWVPPTKRRPTCEPPSSY